MISRWPRIRVDKPHTQNSGCLSGLVLSLLYPFLRPRLRPRRFVCACVAVARPPDTAAFPVCAPPFFFIQTNLIGLAAASRSSSPALRVGSEPCLLPLPPSVLLPTLDSLVPLAFPDRLDSFIHRGPADVRLVADSYETRLGSRLERGPSLQLQSASVTSQRPLQHSSPHSTLSSAVRLPIRDSRLHKTPENTPFKSHSEQSVNINTSREAFLPLPQPLKQYAQMGHSTA